MTIYYNEYDLYAAKWLENLITEGHIAPGVVDTRSIEDVRPSDLAGFTQCHFFAGLGAWSYALRAAGWPDDRPVWTGSCPCQPFSSAGQGAGFADERHLWPAFHHLIKERRPECVLGEQVASKDVDPWIDLVQADLEALGYAVGAVAFPSAGVGAPHIRDRTYWVADAHGAGSLSGSQARIHRGKSGSGARDGKLKRSGTALRLANTDGGAGGQGRADVRGRAAGSDAQSRAGLGGGGVLVGLANAEGFLSENECQCNGPAGQYVCNEHGASGRDSLRDRTSGDSEAQAGNVYTARVLTDEQPGPINGLWADADWLFCRDGKWRPVEPGTSPLAHGAASRVGRLRAYGNAINAEQARVWIETVMECRP